DEVNKASGTQLSSSLKASTSSPLVSPSTTINVHRDLNSIDVAATFRVPLTTVGDLYKLINDIKAGKHEELLSRMTNDDQDGISLIATFIGKLIMLESYTSFMCKASWGKSSFARCLTEVNSEADLVDSVTIGISSLTGDDFTKETIRVEYEWRPPRCDECKIFDHVHDHCSKKMVSPSIVSTSNVVAPTVEKSNDGFQMVRKKKKRKGKSKSTNGGQFTGLSIKQTVRYEPKANTSAPKKGATNVSNPSKSSFMLKTADTSLKNNNFTTSNSFSALNDEEVKNVYDESANLVPDTNTDRSSSFTAAAVIKAQKNQNPEEGQTSMARGNVFRYDPNYLREQFAGFGDSTSVTVQPLCPRANNKGVPEHYATKIHS
nr:zinc knuckle CX2CX4HX4C [Tanacetum cinerariifolium]